ncbi:MAG: RsmF rRNA methyltransferase first C-terminal domain-containing protein [Defluviitaleaceae bacterium]|nr:RsmF rRNA methyltransferase first C-terminal domain-containing protein [Defluviitaleaceae bacterium]
MSSEKLPKPFVEKMHNLLKEEAADFFDALTQESKVSGLRCNPLKVEPMTIRNRLDIPLTPVKWCKTGFYYPSNISNRPSKSPLYHAGLYYLQEPSAMSSVEILAPQPGDKVLDLCAAPGGKAVQIAGHLQNRGILVANDSSAARCRALVKNLAMCGVRNAIITTEQPRRLANRFVGYFDKILVDAPCSGEGMFRKDPDAIKGWSTNKPEKCVAMQREILHYATEMLKAGGRLLYSTCTFDPKENEGTIANFLRTHPEFEIVEIKDFEPGRPDWVDEAPSELTGAARLWPHRLEGEGHFLCLLEKRAAAYKETMVSQQFKKTGNKLSPSEHQLFEDFCQKELTLSSDYFSEGDFGNITSISGKRNDSFLFALPKGMPDMSGLRMARSGWYLGDVKKDRFEPSHALAMGLINSDAQEIVNFCADDDNCTGYLRGESLDLGEFSHSPKEKAWVLVCVNGFPLGWARSVNGRLKNKYPYTS